ncbi:MULTISPECIES: LamG domain-containing protein [Flavobacteriaceae]|uniref:LamG domain-containing protein n=2 Tax=Flavobacteriaceae TaxID=49546 RepID=A0A4Y8AVM3_9FLAO|nr:MULTISPECIES: LamG domain-containing protein [Flavobacteriaceae]TEW75533.1 LamG domain-containing protein [Gramella jeungdoensis]GGK45996.1 hypothetical protein GCM10007963_12820 [Lutibacter litoralis]
MKKLNIPNNIRHISNLLYPLALLILILISCSKNEEGWNDSRYFEKFGIYIYHTNPITGEEYTTEELAELSYNPKVKESYTEGQSVELSVVTEKEPVEVKVLLGSDLSVLEVISEFNTYNDSFRSKSFVSSLEDLNLLEIGDKTTLKFEILFKDNSIGAVLFDIKKKKVFVPNIEFFVYLKKQIGEVIGLNTEDKVVSREKNAEVGTIITLDGLSNKVEVINTPDLDFRHTEDFSVGIWVNTTATNSDPSIIGDKDWGSGSNKGFIFAFLGDNWKLNAGGSGNRIDISGNVINDGEWHFLMATFDRDGNATIYQDGVSLGSADMTALTDMNSGLPIQLGQDGTGFYGDWFEGKLGETYIYDYVLTPEQVAEINSLKTGAQLKTNAGTVKNIEVTNSGATISSEEGRYAFAFDGSNMVTLDNTSDLDFRHTGDFSIALWVNTTATNSDPSIIGDKDWGSGGNKGFIFPFKGSTWGVNAGDGNGNRIDLNGNAINDGEWHLLVATFDRDGDLTLYEDGGLVDSGNMAALGDINSGFPIRLAQDGTGTYGSWFEGKIANSTIFDYVLSPEEITALYNE